MVTPNSKSVFFVVRPQNVSRERKGGIPTVHALLNAAEGGVHAHGAQEVVGDAC